MPAGGHSSLLAMFHFQVLCSCDNKPASSTGQNRDRGQSLGQVRAGQSSSVETFEVAQAPLDNTALRQVRPAQMKTSEATQARLQQVRVALRIVYTDSIL